MTSPTEVLAKPLRTASIVDLREASNREILKLDGALTLPELPERSKFLAEFSAKSDQRVELENAATTTVQRKAYGRKLWDQRFIRMGDVRVPEGCKLSEDQLRKELWRAVNPSNFRRFQELFSDPYNFVVPKFRIERGNRIVFVGNPDFSRMSVAGCLVSPDRIPDDFCRNVLRVKFTAKEIEDPRARFLRKAEIDVIERLKRLWDSSEAVPTAESRSLRVLIIHKPSEQTEARYPNAGPFPLGFHGTLLVTRGDTSDRIQKNNPPLGPDRVRPLRISHFNTIYDAHRRTLHVACGYRGEGEELTTLQTKVKMGLDRIGAEVKKDAPQGVKDSVRDEVSGTIDLGRETLDGSRAAGKRFAAEFFEKVKDCRDKLGRINWGVVVHRMRSADGLINARMGEMTAKGGHVQTDEAHLRTMIGREYTILDTFGETLARNADALLTRQRRAGIASLPPEVRRVQPAVALSRLVPNRHSLEDVTCRPFSTFAGLLRVGCHDLESALQRKDYRQVEESTVKLHIVTKLFTTNDRVQSIKALLIDPDLVPVDEIKREVQAIKTALDRKIVKGVLVRGWEEAFKEIESQVRALDKKLGQTPRANASAASREQYFTEVSALVDAIRPEFTAWSLVPTKWRKGSGQPTPTKAR